MARVVHWPVYIGTRWAKTPVWYLDKAEYDDDKTTATKKNLTGWTGIMVVRRKVGDSAAVATLSTTDVGMTLGGVNGTIALVMDDSVTALISAGLAVFDVVLTDTSGDAQPPIIEGTFDFILTSSKQ